MTAIIRFLLLITATLLSGCGTLISMIEQDYSVYAGVSRDFAAMQHGGISSVAAAIDLPLSFVLDTLLLPLTLTR